MALTYLSRSVVQSTPTTSIIPQGIGHIAKRLPEIPEDGENGLPDTLHWLIERLGSDLKELDRKVQELEVRIQVWHRENAAIKMLAQIRGIGPITASALVTSIGDAMNFQQWPATGSVAGAGAATKFQRRQADAAGDQQAR